MGWADEIYGDKGTVTIVNSDNFQVKWDAATESYTYQLGGEFHARTQLYNTESDEIKAVQLLLSLGYTLSKKPIVTNVLTKPENCSIILELFNERK